MRLTQTTSCQSVVSAQRPRLLWNWTVWCERAVDIGGTGDIAKKSLHNLAQAVVKFLLVTLVFHMSESHPKGL
jgi:hypothetical protein